MKNFKVLSIITMLSLIVLMSGCLLEKGEPNKPADEVIKEAFAKTTDIKSAAFELALQGDLAGPEGQSPENIGFDVNIEGAGDNKEEDAQKLTMLINGTANIDNGGDNEFGGDIRLDTNTMYFMLSKLSDFGGLIPMEMVDPFMGKWYMMELPEDSFDLYASIEGENEGVKELMKETDFFKDLKFIGNEKVMGENCYKYSGSLDKKAFREFAIKSGEITQGVAPSEADVEELDAFLETFELDALLWVAGSDMTLRGLGGNLVLDVKDGARGTITFDLKMGDFDKSVKVKAPEGAELFDPMMFLLGGMEQPGMDEFEDFDASEMEDFDMEGFEDLEGMEGIELPEASAAGS